MIVDNEKTVRPKAAYVANELFKPIVADELCNFFGCFLFNDVVVSLSDLLKHLKDESRCSIDDILLQVTQ